MLVFTPNNYDNHFINNKIIFSLATTNSLSRAPVLVDFFHLAKETEKKTKMKQALLRTFLYIWAKTSTIIATIIFTSSPFSIPTCFTFHQPKQANIVNFDINSTQNNAHLIELIFGHIYTTCILASCLGWYLEISYYFLFFLLLLLFVFPKPHESASYETTNELHFPYFTIPVN